MKKYLFGLVFLSVFAAFLIGGFRSSAQDVSDAPIVSTTLVLSQVSGGNGYYNNDWVEIKNVSAGSQSLNGLSLYYGSATGNFASSAGGAFALPNVSLAPGQYYLVQLSSAAPGTTPLPVAPDAANTTIAMSGTSGKVGIVNSGQLSINTCGATATPCNATQLAAFVDWVAWGAAGNGPANSGEGGNPSVNNGVAILATQGMARKSNGCTDTDNNNSDFDLYTNPPTPPIPQPRNTSTALAPCGGGSGQLQGFGNASPGSVAQGGSTLLTVTVVPATSPTPSTGITVNTDLTAVGGAANQQFYDDGTHGDVTPGNNVFSFSAVVAVTTPVGNVSLPASIADAQSNTATASINLTITGPTANEDPLLLGNPSGATANVANENNYLMQKAPYSLSYSRAKATANWVAWRLDSNWIGSSNNGNFAPDTTLPGGWYQVQPGDYSEPVYDRGHMCPSGDRTNTQANNDLTYLMTNIIPQHPDNNQGPWVDFENYCRSLANSGNEIYIISGPSGNIGTIGATAQNRIVVPAITWKVVLVLPNGSNDLQRVSKGTRAFGIIMQNTPQTRTTPWRNFRVTVNQVEYLTGYDFFDQIPRNTQELIERRRDRQ